MDSMMTAAATGWWTAAACRFIGGSNERLGILASL
jgi:hypothetical protein